MIRETRYDHVPQILRCHGTAEIVFPIAELYERYLLDFVGRALPYLKDGRAGPDIDASRRQMQLGEDDLGLHDAFSELRTPFADPPQTQADVRELAEGVRDLASETGQWRQELDEDLQESSAEAIARFQRQGVRLIETLRREYGDAAAREMWQKIHVLLQRQQSAFADAAVAWQRWSARQMG